MGASKRQWIVLAFLCVTLAIVAVYRLSGDDGKPVAAAQDGSIVPETADEGREMAAMIMPSDEEVWDLPTVDELRMLFAREWRVPTSDPFVLPPRMRVVVSASPPSATSPREATAVVALTREVVPPSFTVRSACYLSGVWYAEIDERVYCVGDELDGYRIDRIGRDAIWVSVRGEHETPSSSVSQRPSCVMRVGDQVMGMVDGHWLVRGEGDQESAVRGVGPHPFATDHREDETDPPMDQRPRQIRVKVAHGS